MKARWPGWKQTASILKVHLIENLKKSSGKAIAPEDFLCYNEENFER